MSRWITKRGDLEPLIQCRLRQRNGAAIDFAGATVVFVYKRTGAEAVRRAATLVSYDATSAIVQYVWQAEDVANAPESFPAEWEVTLASGKVMTFPKGGYITIVVNEDLR